MATWIDSAISLRVKVAFGDTWQTASPTWTDVTDDVRGAIEITKGSGSALSEPAPATARFALDNRDRKYDPTYTSGAYYGDLLPMVPVLIEARKSGGSPDYDPLFTGYVMGWPQDFIYDVDGLSRVECVDAFHILNNRRLPESAYAAAVEGDTSTVHYWALQDAGPQIDRVGTLPLEVNSKATITAVTSNYPVGEAAAVTVANNNGYFASEAPTTPRGVSFWLTADSDGSAYGTVYVVAGDEDFLTVGVNNGRLTVLYYSNVDENRTCDLAYSLTLPLVEGANLMTVWSTGTYLTVRVNGVTIHQETLTASTTASGQAIGVRVVGVTEGISHLAVYDAAPTASPDPYLDGRFAFGHPYGDDAATRIGRVLDEIGWPSAARDLTAGATVLGAWLPGGGTALGDIRRAVSADQGLFFVAADGSVTYRDRRALADLPSAHVWADDGGGLDYTAFRPAAVHVDNIRNVAVVTYADGTVARRDSTSEAAYGPQEVSVDASLIGSGAVATSLASYLVRVAADPATHIDGLTFVVRDAAGTGSYTAAAEMEVGQAVAVDITPLGVGSQVTFTGVASQVLHTITADQWAVTVRTVPQPPQAADADYFVIGDATAGRLGPTNTYYLPH